MKKTSVLSQACRYRTETNVPSGLMDGPNVQAGLVREEGISPLDTVGEMGWGSLAHHQPLRLGLG